MIGTLHTGNRSFVKVLETYAKKFKKLTLKNQNSLITVLLGVTSLLISAGISAQTTVSFNTPGTATWVCPTGVTSITVECWGAGGAGGGSPSASNLNEGGGGGGAYAKTTSVAVTPGNSYTYTVGTGGVGGTGTGGTGGNSTITLNTATVTAAGGIGGTGGAVSQGGGGAGGNTGSVGGAINIGGSGAAGTTVNFGGGGGSSGGTSAAGNPGSGSTGGSVTGGGTGGAGATSNGTAGSAGSSPGGGGGGVRRNQSGGAGGSGQINITYTLPVCTTPSAPTSLSLTPTSSSVTGTFTAPGTVPTGYLVVRTTTSSAPTTPVTGTSYTAGSTALGGYIVSTNTTTGFTDNTVSGGTQYWYWVYSYNTTTCTGGPTYSSSLSGNTITLVGTTYTSAGTYVVPSGVTSITVYAWGGGGAGGGDGGAAGGQSYYANGGGGGGAASTFNTLTVVPGQTYTITVGAGGTGSTGNGTAGGTTTFTGTAGTITAGGGGGGGASVGTSGAATGGTGGTAGTAGSGGTTKAGGAGSAANDATTTGNGGVDGTGGGAGGQTGIGGTPTSACGVTGAGGTGTYVGGTGNGNTACGTTTSASGTAGSVPGGGGGGANDYTASETGGAGGAGQVIVVYTPAACTTPSAPTALPTTTSTTTSISGTITAPSTAPTGYIVVTSTSPTLSAGPVNGTTYTAGTSSLGGGTVQYVGTSTSYTTVGTLTINTQYYIFVYSYNSGCVGTPYYSSNTGTTISTNFTTLPGAPTIGTATAGNTTASVAFTAPAGGTATITNYTAISNPAGGTSVATTTSPITVTGLTNGIAYTFTVTATNAGGTGAASAASNSVTPIAPCVTPSAPTALPANTSTTTSISGTITAPSTAPTGYIVVTSTSPTLSAGPVNGTAYTAGTSALGGGTVQYVGASTSYTTVGTLTINTKYYIFVYSYNSGCTGAPYYSSNTATTISTNFTTLPGAPTIGTATAGNTTASVAFTAPAGGTATITNYTAISNPAGGTSVATATSPITVTGLTNGVAYTFTVTATNAGGTGAASAASNSVTPIPPCTTPSAPTSLGLTPTAYTVAGTFTAPGTVPTGYLVIRTTTSSAPTTPVSGTTYTAGNTALGGYIVSTNTTTGFTDNGLTASTQYWYWVYSYNSTTCSGGPLYSTSLNGNTTTLVTPTSFTFTTAGTTTFVVPSGVTAITVQSWGGGGGGGLPTAYNASGYATSTSGGGGGGGAYATQSFTGLTSGTTYYVNVGTGGASPGGTGSTGGSSWFNSVNTITGATVLAVGGAGGPLSASSGGSGGLASACTPTTGAFSGGAGGGGILKTNAVRGGGGGGSSAGTASAGNTGGSATTTAQGSGAAAVAGGGAGGDGGFNSIGVTGFSPGGGGGGSDNVGDGGGSGSTGEVIISFSATACVVPSAPTTLSLTAPTSGNITGTFTAPGSVPSGYLIIRTTTSAAPTAPSNGTTYTAGTNALGGYIVSTNVSTGFSDNNVSPSTPYWYWIYSYNSYCIGTPYYSTTSLNGTITSSSCSSRTLYWAGDFSTLAHNTSLVWATAANWSTTSATYTAATTAPDACTAVIIPLSGTSTNVTLPLTANTTIASLTITSAVNSAPFFIDAGAFNFNILGNLSMTNSSTTGEPVLAQAGGSITVGGTSTIGGASDAGSSYIGADGSSGTPGNLYFGGNVTFNPNAIVNYGNLTNVTFNSSSAQTISNTDATANNVQFNNVTVASALTIAGTATDFMYVDGGNLSITSNASLNIPSGYALNQATSSTGTFTMYSGSTLTLSGATTAATDAVAGSNFPGGFATYSFDPASTVVYNATTAQTIYSTPGYGNLTLNNTAGTSTGGATTVAGVLTLTNGILTTTATNSLTVTNTATTAISGGSTAAFVNGPLKWVLPAGLSISPNVYIYPLGASTTYLPFSITSLSTGSTSPTLAAQAFAASAGGTGDGTTLATTGSLSTTEYWTTVLTGAAITNASVSLTRQTAVSPLNVIAENNTKTGAYTSYGGTPGSKSINNSINIANTATQYYVMAQTPTITISTALSPTSVSTCVGTASSNMTLSVSGAVMLAGITVTAPTGFEVSLSASTGFGSSVVVGSGGTIASTIVYVRLAATDAVGSYSGNIVLSSTAATSVNAAISSSTVNPLTAITANPLSTQTGCQNATPTTLSVTATGIGTLAYQWYSNTTNSNTGGTVISGSTSSTYVPSTATSGTKYYYVIVTGTCGTATSTTSAVIVNASTVITASPLSTQTDCQNATPTTLSVTATGTGTLTYQWYSNITNSNTGGTVISGATSSTYVPSTTIAGTTYYYVIVTGTCGTATSATATVIVNPSTVITASPLSSQTVCQSATPTTLNVTATGAGTLTYQWYSNTTNSNTGGTVISGATSSTYVPSTTIAGTMYYYVIVTGTCGTSTSATATVIVNASTVIATQPTGAIYCPNATATPLSVAATGTGTLTYQWYSNASNSNTGGTLISGATSSTYTPSTTTTSVVYYYVTVTGTCGIVTSNTATVLVRQSTKVSSDPTGATYCQNATATALSITATGAGTLTYQWYSNTVNSTTTGTIISGATSSSYTPSTAVAGTIYYFNVVAGTCNKDTSNTAGIVINASTVITANPLSTQTNCQNATPTTLSVTATGTSVSYQWYSNTTNSNTGGTLISGSTSSTYVPSTTASGTVYYYIIVSGTCGTATSTTAAVVVNASTVITANPSGATYCQNATATALTVTATGTGTLSYQWYNNGTTNSTTGGTAVGTNSSSYTPSTVTAGTTYYYVIATGTCGTATSTTAAVIVNASTTISANPLSTQTVCQNATPATLSVTANGTSVTYQWYSNTTNSNTGGTLISGATSSTYVPSTATAGTVYYYVIVSGTCGIVTSNTATVTVTTPPSATISYSGSPYCSSGGTATVTISGTTGGTYSSTTGLVIDGPSGDVNLSSSTAGTYTVTYTVAAAGGCAVYTTTASITITTAPSGTINYYGSPYCPGTGTATVTSTVNTTGGTYTASPAGLSIDPSTGTVDLSLSLSGTYTVTYTVSGTGGCSTYTVTTMLTIGVDTWTGVTSTDWNDGTNWSCGHVPSINSDAVIPAVGGYYPSVSTAGPAATVHNLTINSGASLTVTSQTLQVSDSINNSGTFDVSIGTLELNGRNPQFIPAGAFTGNKIRNLVISNNVSLNGTDSLTGNLSFGASLDTFSTNGNLTLRSTASRTGSVGIIANGNAISGNVTVERYIATGPGTLPSDHAKSWELLAVPTMGQTINQSWMEGATASNVALQGAGASNPKPGYGTMITSNVANAATFPTPGFDAYTAPGPTVKAYNYATNSYVGPATTGAAVYDQRGWFTFVRGDRSVYTASGAGSTADHTILRTTGTLITPAVSQPVSTVPAGYFQSVGNPFASPVDMTKISATGGMINQYIYVWDPRVGGSYNYGAFVTLQYDGTNYEVQTNGGYSYPANGTVYNYIQNGQAFFMYANAANGDGTVTFPETAKVPDTTFITPFTRQGDGGTVNSLPGTGARVTGTQTPSIRTSLNTVNADGSTGSVVDQVLNQYDDSYSNSVDGYDGRKAANTGENLSINTTGTLLVVEKRHTIVGNDTIFLNLTSERVQAYQFNINASSLSTVDSGFIIDNYLNTRRQLNLKGNTKVNFNVVNVAGSYAANRFELVFVALKVLPSTIASVRAYQQSRGSTNINVDWSVSNEHGIQKYVVERSADSVTFTRLTVSKPTANDGSDVSYSVTDSKPLSGTNYYRIRMVDTLGNITYSVIVSVNIGAVKNNIEIYPNPVTDGKIHLQFSNEKAGKYGIRLLDKSGQVISEKQITRQEGNSTELLEWNYSIAHGIYQVEITRPDGSTKNINVLY